MQEGHKSGNALSEAEHTALTDLIRENPDASANRIAKQFSEMTPKLPFWFIYHRTLALVHEIRGSTPKRRNSRTRVEKESKTDRSGEKTLKKRAAPEPAPLAAPQSPVVSIAAQPCRYFVDIRIAGAIIAGTRAEVTETLQDLLTRIPRVFSVEFSLREDVPAGDAV